MQKGKDGSELVFGGHLIHFLLSLLIRSFLTQVLAIANIAVQGDHAPLSQGRKSNFFWGVCVRGTGFS